MLHLKNIEAACDLLQVLWMLGRFSAMRNRNLRTERTLRCDYQWRNGSVCFSRLGVNIAFITIGNRRGQFGICGRCVVGKYLWAGIQLLLERSADTLKHNHYCKIFILNL